MNNQAAGLRFLFTVFLLSMTGPAWSQTPPLVPPNQDEGLPYTRSGVPRAIERIAGGIAVFPGSRYGYVDGRRVRLSQTDVLRAEAKEIDGRIYVPVEFARLLAPGRKAPPPVPSDLAPIADRWVDAPSDWQAGPFGALDGIKKLTLDGGEWVDFEASAEAAGSTVTRTSGGVVYAGRERLTSAGEAAEEALVTLFDTPEKFARPEIATKHIPALRRQGPWTDHVAVSPEQLALVNGPETEWKTVPEDQFDFSGINRKLFGSEVPPPGVYPRLFFSPQDLPGLRQRVKSTVSGQKTLIEMEEVLKRTWFDPDTDDGKLFNRLASGDLDSLEWDVPEGKPAIFAAHQFKGFKGGVYSSHIAYVPECLTSIALYALLQDDEELGRKAATALSNYYRLREPLLDQYLAISDSEWGSGVRQPDGSVVELGSAGARTHWRNVHGLVAQQNLAIALDFGGKWMTPAQIDGMRRFIAKATYGRRSHGQDGPIRFRDVNWMAWDLPHFLAVSVIEGLPGFDPEAYASGAESARAFCQWGVDPDGVVFESNGKTAGAFQFQLLSMVIVARRGENLFGHPHWRNLLEGQVQMTSPDGRVVVNSGTQYTRHSRQPISPSLVSQFKAFYPESRVADYLLTTLTPTGGLEPGALGVSTDFDPVEHRRRAAATPRLRLPSPSYPGFTRAILFDADTVPTTRAELGLPLDFSAPVHGVFSAYSSAMPDAAWINMMVRPNHYLGAGHHHSDAGMFHFSALGVNWFTESPFTQWYTGNVHNLVLVDGVSQGAAPGVEGTSYNAAASYLGANLGEAASSATADLTYAYSWRWNTQPAQIWPADTEQVGWAMDPSPFIAKIFAGTARYKLRPWWSNYTFGNYLATSRAASNPMRYVFRTTGLVRGDHPFGFVVDDLRKDDATRLYQWTAMLNGGVWQAAVAGLPSNAIALGATGKDTDVMDSTPLPAIEPKAGDPLLIVYALGMDAPDGLPLLAAERVPGQPTRKGEPQFMDRLVVNHRGKEAAFRILLLPTRAGDPLPTVKYDADRGTATVSYKGESTELTFSVDDRSRTKTSVSRGGKSLLTDSIATPPPGRLPGA